MIEWSRDRFVERPGAVHIKCAECSRDIWLPASKVKIYKRCSLECSAAHRAKVRSERARTCEGCKQEFVPRQWQIQNGIGRFCSHACQAHGLRRREKTEPPSVPGIITPFQTCPESAEWRVVAEFPNYEISEYGHIRRAVAGSNTKIGAIIRPRWNGHYADYNLSSSGQRMTLLTHILVCETFHGPKPSPENMVAHWDGNGANNHKSNLRWATALENSGDRDRHGRTPRGDNHPSRLKPWTRPRGEGHALAKLTEADIRAIRASSESNPDTACRYGVDRALILRIRKGVIWKHVI